MNKVRKEFFDAPKGAQYAGIRYRIPQPHGITECEILFYKKIEDKENELVGWKRYDTDSDNEYPQWVCCSAPKKKNLIKLIGGKK